MMNRIGILNFGLGNLRSIENAFNEIGVDCIVSADAKLLRNCQKLILPGVGAFKHGIESLRELKLDNVILDGFRENKPILGICLGMQMLLDKSYEFGQTNGLGLIKGEVKSLQKLGTEKITVKLPHVKWSSVKRTMVESEFANYLLKDTMDSSEFYFIHSFFASAQATNIVAESEFLDKKFPAVIANNNLVGMQFHPEKSGKVGLSILKNFVNYN